MTVELPGKPNRKTISRWRRFGIADGFLWLRTEHAGDGVLRLLADTNGGGEG